MTWSYDVNLSTGKDQCRFLTGDTDTNDQIFADEEIAWTISENGSNVYLASSALCEAAASKYARLVSLELEEDVAADLDQISKMYKEMAKDFRTKAGWKGLGGSSAFAGGISISNKDSYEGDSDRVAPMFTKDMHNNV